MRGIVEGAERGDVNEKIVEAVLQDRRVVSCDSIEFRPGEPCSLRLLKRQGFDARSWLGRFSPDWAKCHKLIDAGLVASREFQPKPQMRNDFSRSQIAALAVMTARLVLLARLL